MRVLQCSIDVSIARGGRIPVGVSLHETEMKMDYTYELLLNLTYELLNSACNKYVSAYNKYESACHKHNSACKTT